MIDRPARDSVALLIRRLASGRISNQDYEDAWWATKTHDEAVRAVLDAGWALYDDYRTYRLRGAAALPPATLAAISRCVLFLTSDLEYEWPPLRPSPLFLAGTLLTLGIMQRRRRARWEASGDHHVWPFRRYSDFKRALAHPPFLAGPRERAA